MDLDTIIFNLESFSRDDQFSALNACIQLEPQTITAGVKRAINTLIAQTTETELRKFCSSIISYIEDPGQFPKPQEKILASPASPPPAREASAIPPTPPASQPAPAPVAPTDQHGFSEPHSVSLQDSPPIQQTSDIQSQPEAVATPPQESAESAWGEPGVVSPELPQPASASGGFATPEGENYPDVPSALRAAKQYQAEGKLPQALAAYDQLINLSPNDPNAFFYRASLHSKMGNFAGALADFDNTLNLDSKHYSACWARGVLFEQKKDWDKVIKAQNKAIRINKEFLPAYVTRAMAYLQKADYGSYMKAGEDFEKILQLDPSNTQALVGRGELNLATNEYDEALTDLTRAIEIDPENGRAYLFRSQVYNELEKPDLASADSDKAKSLGVTA